MVKLSIACSAVTSYYVRLTIVHESIIFRIIQIKNGFVHL